MRDSCAKHQGVSARVECGHGSEASLRACWPVLRKIDGRLEDGYGNTHKHPSHMQVQASAVVREDMSMSGPSC